jgi:hypothetical protein
MEIVNVEKYYDKIQEKFPGLTKNQIDRIVKFGMRSYYNHNLYGGDVLNKAPYFTMYTGKLFGDNILFYKYWIIKTRIKLRIKYKRNKTKYDGYYYFGLSDSEFEDYQKQFKKTGRKKKIVTFDKIYAYKIKDECLLNNRYKHIFKIAYPADVGFTLKLNNYTTRNFEYIFKRNKDNTIQPINYENRNK